MSITPSSLVRLDTGPLIHPEISQPRRPLEGDTVFRSLDAFTGDHGRVSSGVWESTAGKFRSDTTGYIEFCHILAGSARVVDPDGTIHTLQVGDSFIMPEGYKGHWEIDQFVKKIYFITLTR